MNKDLSDWVNGVVKENYSIKEWDAFQDGYAQACKDSDDHYKEEIDTLKKEINKLRSQNNDLLKAILKK